MLLSPPKRMHDPLAGKTPEKYPQKRRADTSGRVLKETLVQLDTD